MSESNNHPRRKKLSISDLKCETISAKDCRRRFRVGGLECYRYSDWQAAWYLNTEHDIQVGLAYRGAVCAISSIGFSGYAHGIISLQESDWNDILAERCGDPDELKGRKRRERRLRHEILLWRLEEAQHAVNMAVARKQDDDNVDLVKVAREAFYS